MRILIAADDAALRHGLRVQVERWRYQPVVCAELEQALDMVKKLSGLLPIWSYCKRIREDGQYLQLEVYLSEHSEAEFSHGICPDCLERAHREFGG
jgi:CheY-like chemotaxis protein